MIQVLVYAIVVIILQHISISNKTKRSVCGVEGEFSMGHSDYKLLSGHEDKDIQRQLENNYEV